MFAGLAKHFLRSALVCQNTTCLVDIIIVNVIIAIIVIVIIISFISLIVTVPQTYRDLHA